MQQNNNTNLRRLQRIGLALCAVGAVVAIAISQYRPGPVVLRLDESGTLHFSAVSLANTNVQKLVYGAINTLGFKAEVAVPSFWFTNMAEPGYRTNIDIAYSRMKRAGVLTPVPTVHLAQ